MRKSISKKLKYLNGIQALIGFFILAWFIKEIYLGSNCSNKSLKSDIFNSSLGGSIFLLSILSLYYLFNEPQQELKETKTARDIIGEHKNYSSLVEPLPYIPPHYPTTGVTSFQQVKPIMNAVFPKIQEAASQLAHSAIVTECLQIALNFFVNLKQIGDDKGFDRQSFDQVKLSLSQLIELLIEKFGNVDSPEEELSLKEFFIHRNNSLQTHGVLYFIRGSQLIIDRLSSKINENQSTFQ